MGKVIAVRYRLFESETPVVAAALAGEPHTLDGEVVLCLEHGAEAFVSWSNEPVQHAVAIQHASFFLTSASLASHDLSCSPFWSPLIGSELQAHSRHPDHQVLELIGPDQSVFACSYDRGQWHADAVTICWEVPEHGA